MKPYRPAEAKWDDDLLGPTGLEKLIDANDDFEVWQPYDYRAVRLCFACLDSHVVNGSIYCAPCARKRERRINGK